MDIAALSREFSFQNLPIPEAYSELQGEISLGRAVLDQALVDLIRDPINEKTWWNGVRTWDEEKRGEDAGFYTICYLAGFEPEAVRRIADFILEELTGETL